MKLDATVPPTAILIQSFFCVEFLNARSCLSPNFFLNFIRRRFSERAIIFRKTQKFKLLVQN